MDKERGEGKSGWGFVFGSSGGFREGQVTRSENLDYFGGKVVRNGNLGGFGGRFWASLGVGISVN